MFITYKKQFIFLRQKIWREKILASDWFSLCSGQLSIHFPALHRMRVSTMGSQQIVKHEDDIKK